jgi:ketosteroid isomerase-like protein
MSVEHNKVIVAQFFNHLSAGDIPAALALMTEDVTWLLPGKPESMPSAGSYPKERLGKLFHIMFKQLKNGLKMTLKSSIGEGDKVALEAESYGELSNGRIYNQSYHFLMEFRDGKISAVREYLDTQHAFAVWFEPVVAVD